MYKIMASTNLRNNYNQISEIAKKEPVILTKNGEGDLVVMGIDLFQENELRQKEKELELEFYKQALDDELDFQEGKYFTAGEMSKVLEKYITNDSPEIREEIRKKYS